MKRKLLKSLFLSMLATVCLMLVACVDESEDSSPISTSTLALDKSELMISQYANGWLFVDYDGEDSIVWTSSSECVATVENGKIIGVGIGTTVITATAGDSSDSCEVTVTAADVTKFTFSPTAETVTLYANDTVDSGFILAYDKIPVDKTLSYEVENTTIAEVSASGIIEAKYVGETLLTATVEIEGKTLTATMNIMVIPDHSVKIGQGIPTLYPYASYDDKNYVHTANVSATVYYKGEPLNEASTVLWSVPQNQDVATVSGNTVMGVNAGEVMLTASYTANGITVTDSVAIKVSAITTFLDKTIEVGMYGGWQPDMTALGLPTDTDITVAALSVNGEMQTLRTEENIVYFDDIEEEEGTITLTSRNFAFEFPVTLWTAVIYDAEDMEALKEATTGRYKFAADIDMSGVIWNSTAVFNGLIDGGEHKLYNLTMETGLFANYQGGMVKNLAFVDVVALGNNIGVIGSQYDRKSATPIVIDNVFLSVASTKTAWYIGLLGLCNLKDANAFTMKNSVIMNNISDGNAEKVGVIGRVGSYAINMTNCYLINTKGYVASLNGGTTEGKDALHLPSTNTAYSYMNADVFAEEYLGGNISGISDFVLNLAVSKMSVTLIDGNNIKTLLTATSGSYILIEDIDMSKSYTDNGGVWTSTAVFTGTINGNGHTISNLNTTTGLFAEFNGGMVKNLALTNVATTGSIGVIATGYNRNAATAITIDNVYVHISSNNGGSHVGLLGKANLKTDYENVRHFVMKNSVIVSDMAYGAVIGQVGTGAMYMDNCHLVNTKGYEKSLNTNLDADAQAALHLPSTNTAYSYENVAALKTACENAEGVGLSDFLLSKLDVATNSATSA